MGKAILFLVVVGAAVLAYIVYTSSRAVAPQSEDKAAPGGVSNRMESTAAALRRATGEATQPIADGAKALKEKAVSVLEEQTTALKAPVGIEVKAGGQVEFKVARVGGKKATKLELLPAPESGVTATGGEFKEGQTETTVTVAASLAARADAGLTIKLDTARKEIAVKVK